MTSALKGFVIFVTNLDVKKRTAFQQFVKDNGATLAFGIAAATHVVLADATAEKDAAHVRERLKHSATVKLLTETEVRNLVVASSERAVVTFDEDNISSTSSNSAGDGSVVKPHRAVLKSVPVINLMLPDRVPCSGVHKVNGNQSRELEREHVLNAIVFF
jgi:hypothetical protein